jgi:hypothetical protein
MEYGTKNGKKWGRKKMGPKKWGRIYFSENKSVPFSLRHG